MIAKKTKHDEAGARLARALVDGMNALSKVMEEETVCLAKNDFTKIEILREKKTRLLRDCQMNVGTVAQKPDILRDMPIDVRNNLRASRRLLDEVGQKNAYALEGAMRATEALIQTVVDVARKGTRHTECYADPRKTPLLLGSYSPICEPVAYNRTA